MNDFTKLFEALNSFRNLFIRNYLAQTELAITGPFLKSMASKSHKLWTISEAQKLYLILKQHSDKFRLVGFDFSKVPQVQINLNQSTGTTSSAAAQQFQRRPKEIGYNGTKFTVTFPYSKDIYVDVKAIKGAVYADFENKIWTVPVTSIEEITRFAKKYYFDISERAQSMMDNIGNNLEQSYSDEYIELGIALKKTAYNYQTVGIDYIRRNKHVIVGDQMRLGKTIQAIGGVLITDTFPSLMIVKKTQRLQWQDEWHAWTDKKAVILSHKNKKKIPGMIAAGLVDVLITNYNGIETFFIDEVKEIEITKGKNAGVLYDKVKASEFHRMFKSTVLDEAHNVKNKQTTRYKCIKEVFKDKELRLCLTGSPVVKGPKDLANLLELIGRIDEFGGYDKFVKQYSKIDKNSFDSTAKNLTDELKALNVKMRSLCFIRRERHQVREQISEKFRKIIRVELTNRSEYDHAEFSLQDWLAANGYTSGQISRALNAEILVQKQKLKILSSRGKIEAAKELVTELIENGEKVIIGCWFNETVQCYKDAFPQYNPVTICGFIDGQEMKDEHIHANKHRFQTDPECKLIIITYGKGGEGHTLSAGDNVVAVELGYHYTHQAQMEDRAVAVNKLTSVNAYTLIGQESVDEDDWQTIEIRRQIEAHTIGSSEKIETNELHGSSLTVNRIMARVQKNVEI